MSRVLVAGIGNIFFGDDAFGCEVAAELVKRSWPDGVNIVDFGIRAYDLAYAIMDGYDATILIDAAPRGERPGTVYLLELDPEGYRLPLRQAGLLTRDPRMKERKKYGLKRARKAPQYTKR